MTTALLFQGGLVVFAIALAWLFGLAPWRDVHVSSRALTISLVATLPLAASLLLMPRGRWAWADELTDLVGRFLRLLFRHARPGAIALVSVLAGVGEELLFRGVIQSGLIELGGPLLGIMMASLLFGAAHAVSISYLLLASVMGLYLGLIYHWTDNLLIPIVIHALYDWIAIHFYLRRRRFA